MAWALSPGCPCAVTGCRVWPRGTGTAALVPHAATHPSPCTSDESSDCVVVGRELSGNLTAVPATQFGECDTVIVSQPLSNQRAQFPPVRAPVDHVSHIPGTFIQEHLILPQWQC